MSFKLTVYWFGYLSSLSYFTNINITPVEKHGLPINREWSVNIQQVKNLVLYTTSFHRYFGLKLYTIIHSYFAF